MMMIQIISNPIHNLDWWKINKFPMGSRLTLFSIMFELLSSVMRDQWCCVLLQHRMTTLLREQLGSFESRSLDRMVRKSCTIFLLASCFILTSYNKEGHQKINIKISIFSICINSNCSLPYMCTNCFLKIPN